MVYHRKSFCYAALALFALPLFFLNIHDDYNWGDDFAQYIKEAQNISEGKPFYESNYIYNPLNFTYAPPQYPVGYPLLLAPIVKYAGLSIRPMLYLNAVLLTMLLFALYHFYRRYASDIISVCLAVICVYCAPVVEYKQYVLSDIACMTFVALHFTIRESTFVSKWKYLMLVSVGAFAILIRSQAILIPLAELAIAGLAIAKSFVRNKVVTFKSETTRNALVGASGVLALYFVIDKIIFVTPNTHLSFYSNLFSIKTNYFQLIGYNAKYVLYLFHDVFLQTHNVTFVQTIAKIISWFLVCLGGIGFARSLKVLRTHNVFFIFMCSLMLVMPVHQGVRYIFPIIPILVLYVFDGAAFVLATATSSQKTFGGISFAVVFLLLGLNNYSMAINPNLKDRANKNEDQQAFDYVKENIGDTDVVLFTKPRLLTLLTNKRAINIAWQCDYATNKRLNDSLKVNYMLWRSGVSEQYFRDYLFATNSCSDSVVINDFFTLYKLK